ncbi:glycosyltransferase [bacterium]|nr:glycosyltransferase [bacterium]
MIKICRIAYLITELNIGGAENSLYQLVTHLNSKRFSPVVYSLSGEGKIADKLRDKGIEVICLGAKSKLDITVFFKLIKLLHRKKPHVLHTYLFHANFIGRIAGWLNRIPIIISTIQVMEKEKLYHLYLDMLTQWMVNKEVCVSKQLEEFTRKRVKISSSKLVTIYNAVDITSVKPLQVEAKNELTRNLSLSGFHPIIGTVARLTTQKGIPYLLKAFQLILKNFPDCCLLVVGQGPQKQGLETLSEGLGISSNVKFLGFREDINEIMNLMDVFVLPSLWEGLPLTILEAQALSKPVVATSVSGSKEIIKDGENGFLAHPKDSQSLALYTNILLENSKMREEFGKKGKEFVNKNFSLDRMVKDTEKLYEELKQKK